MSDSTATARAYLRSRTRLGIKLGLDHTRELMAELGDPQHAFPSLLVAGTNGKGSVVAYLDAALRSAGLVVGRYTSPHLNRLNERIHIGGREVSDARLARAVLRVRDASAARRRRDPRWRHPTFFEAVTAAAFLCFRDAAVDVAVLEVGLGGRLDSTNVAEPLASAIVSIAMDHEAYLGHTLGAIAREKAGILRRGRTGVLGPLPAEATRAIEAAARKVGARLVRARDVVPRLPPGVEPLPGVHQADNMAVAVALLDEAKAAGLPFDIARARRGLKGVHWPGRLQEVAGTPTVLLDGAHNVAGARALFEALRERAGVVLVFGAMADKDVEGMARVLFPRARAVVLTAPRLARAAAPRALQRAAGRWAQSVQVVPGTAAALKAARRLARAGDTIVVAGSLFLVGEALALLSARSGSGSARPRSPRPTPRARRTSPPARPRG